MTNLSLQFRSKEWNPSSILQNSHLNAVIASSFVVRLIEGPRQVVGKRWHGQSWAPSPLSLATFLSCAGPVVEVVRPGAWFFCYTLYFYVLFAVYTFSNVAETIQFSGRLKRYGRQTHAAALLKVLLPSTLFIKTQIKQTQIQNLSETCQSVAKEIWTTTNILGPKAHLFSNWEYIQKFILFFSENWNAKLVT